MALMFDRVKVATATTGTGTITMGTAAYGYRSFPQAGVPDGARVNYVLEDGANWEIGEGVYTAAGFTLARNVRLSSNSNALISLSGSASLMIVTTSEDIEECHPGYVSGRWYAPTFTTGTQGGGGAPGSSFIRFLPLMIRSRVTISDLAATVTTVSSGGLFQVAYYASDPVTKKPIGNPVAKTASLSTTTATEVSGTIVGGNVTLLPGLYWMSTMCDNATAAFRTLTITLDQRFLSMYGSTSLSNIANGHSFALQIASTYGTWPTLTSGSSIAESVVTNHALVHFKVA